MTSKKKHNYAERAERYAKECAANKSGRVPEAVSQAYAKWLIYKGRYDYRPDNLSLACMILEHVASPEDGKRITLHDWQCALLSWPLVFANKDGNRVVNELHFIAPRKVGITTTMAALMIAELLPEFRHGLPKWGTSPIIYAAGPDASMARYAFEKAKDIVDNEPDLQDHLSSRPTTQKEIKSEESGGVIKHKSTESRGFGGLPATFMFVDGAGILKDDERISQIQAQMSTSGNPNYLLVTAGTPGRACPSALNSIRDETLQWLGKKDLGNRVGLLYQAEAADSHADFQVWEKVYPGYSKEELKTVYKRNQSGLKEHPDYYERPLLAKMDPEVEAKYKAKGKIPASQ